MQAFLIKTCLEPLETGKAYAKVPKAKSHLGLALLFLNLATAVHIGLALVCCPCSSWFPKWASARCLPDFGLLSTVVMVAASVQLCPDSRSDSTWEPSVFGPSRPTVRHLSSSPNAVFGHWQRHSGRGPPIRIPASVYALIVLVSADVHLCYTCACFYISPPRLCLSPAVFPCSLYPPAHPPASRPPAHPPSRFPLSIPPLYICRSP